MIMASEILLNQPIKKKLTLFTKIFFLNFLVKIIKK